MILPLTAMLLAYRADPQRPIDMPGPDLMPTDIDGAYRVQTETVQALGPVGAWKVQPFPLGGEPLASPIPGSVVFRDKTNLDAARFPGVAIEAEVAVTLNRDLPPRESAYGVEDVAGAIGGLHLAIEVLASRFLDPSRLPALVGVADLQGNAAVIVGPSRPATGLPDLGRQEMRLIVDGAEIGRVAAGPSTENMLRSLAWLANHAAARGLALKQGDVVITGARIGALPLNGKTVSIEATGFVSVSASFQ